jgi:hypothetical protein
MKTEHTPGPWTIAPVGYDLAHRKSNHWRITAKSPHVAGKTQTVCELNGPWDEANYAANAHLITAAPELLEACQSIMSAHGAGVQVAANEYSPLLTDALLVKLSQAIFKATGNP